MQGEFSITNKTRGKLPSLPFLAMKDGILGKGYSLSIAFVLPADSHKLNKTYRKKDKPTNVLSFSLDKNNGELVLCPKVIKEEAKLFDRTYENFLGYLAIHGMLHLKGLDHGRKMDQQEKKFEKKYLSRSKK